MLFIFLKIDIKHIVVVVLVPDLDMEIDFADLFTDGATTLEVYLCSSQESHDADIRVGRSKPFDVRAHGSLSLREYYYRDIVCSYDQTNDSQRVTRRTLIKDFHVGNIYILVLKEDQVPSYTFPVTTDIATSLDIQRKTLRLNNRMHIVNDVENSEHHYLYIRYTHSDAVDVTRMKHDLNGAIGRLLSFA